MGIKGISMELEGVARSRWDLHYIRRDRHGSRRDHHRSKRDCHGFRRGRFENYQQKVTPMELKGSKYEKERKESP